MTRLILNILFVCFLFLEGRVGKTALLNSLNNEPFKETMSTKGAAVDEACILDRNDVDARGETWKRRSLVLGASSELERAVVRKAAETEEENRRKEKKRRQKQNNDDNANDCETGMERKAEAESQDQASSTASSTLPATPPATPPPTTAMATKKETPFQPIENIPKVEEEHRDTSQIMSEQMRQMDDAQLSRLVKDGAYKDLTISTWDYGGQEVFYTLHNLFLNREGVYLVVFNLEHLTTKANDFITANSNNNDIAETFASRALRFINFWLASIAIHAGTDKGAPVFLVGTHKDCLSASSAVVDMDELLRGASKQIEKECDLDRDGFRIQRYSKDVVFYACDTVKRTVNLKTEAGFTVDKVVIEMRQKIMTAIKEDPRKYIEEEVPCRWMEIYDSIMEHRRNFKRVSKEHDEENTRQLVESKDAHAKEQEDQKECKTLGEQVSIGQIEEIAKSKGVLKEDVPKMLQFFKALGLCVYFAHPASLGRTVILEPQWLIDAISLVINDHRLHGPVRDVLKNMFQTFSSKVVPENKETDKKLITVNMKELVSSLGVTFSPDDLQALHTLLDTNRDGCVDLDEWVNWSLGGIWRVSVSSGSDAQSDGSTFDSRVDQLLTALHDQALSIVEKNHVVGWSALAKTGQASRAVLDSLWHKHTPEVRNYLVSIMDRFGLLVQLWDDNQFLIPSLLAEDASISSLWMSSGTAAANFTTVCFHFDYELPPGFFERIQAYLIRKIHRMKNAKESKRCKGGK